MPGHVQHSEVRMMYEWGDVQLTKGGIGSGNGGQGG